MRRSSPEIRARAVALREERGLAVVEIARTLGWSKGAVDSWLLATGAERPGPVPGLQARRTTSWCRGTVTVHPFTALEDARLLELEAQGLTCIQIARALTAADPRRPRAHNTIIGRLRTLARRDERRQRLAELGPVVVGEVTL